MNKKQKKVLIRILVAAVLIDRVFTALRWKDM